MAGDEVLQQVSKRLLNAVRSSDNVGRYGGEEFLIVLNGCSTGDLKERAEEVRNSINCLPCVTSYGTISLSLSVGAITVENWDRLLPIGPFLKEIDAALYRFLTEMQFGIHVSLHRDVMGASFAPRQFHLTYEPSDASDTQHPVFDWPVLFGQSENRFVFDPALLDARPDFGNEITYSMVVHLCDQLMDELQLRTGIAGRVREALLVNLARPTSLEAVARHLKMSTRTLRRKLSEESTSFRVLLDDLRVQVAIKYLRDTNLTIEAIAAALGFSDGANFRHAFRRWTGRPPQEFRNHSRA